MDVQANLDLHCSHMGKKPSQIPLPADNMICVYLLLHVCHKVCDNYFCLVQLPKLVINKINISLINDSPTALQKLKAHLGDCKAGNPE